MLSWIKKVWKDPVSVGVITYFIIWLISKFSTIVKGWLNVSIPLWITFVLIFATYLITRICIYYGKKERKEREERTKKELNRNAEIKKRNDSIWKAFKGLDNMDLELLIKLYNYEIIDPDNENIRLVPLNDHQIYASIIEKTKIWTQHFHQPTYFLCIEASQIGYNMNYEINEYFYCLLKTYAITGQKMKL